MSAATAMCTKGGLVTFLFQSTTDTQPEGGEVYTIGTAKRKLERRQFSTSSLFVKI